MRWRTWFWLLGVIVLVGGQRSDGQELPITARAALLADAASGKILWALNPHLRCYPASLTKIMTALLIMERGNLEDWVTVPKEAAFTGESSMALKEGERVQLRDLLNAILVRSANDACVAAAIHLAGSVEQFVVWMNEKAQELGMTNTHFVNPHGLHDPQHYTTANDLLLLTRAALSFPLFRQIVAQREIVIAPTGKSALRHYWNRNKLLTQYPGCDGVKTGYTVPAKRCFVASATRNGWQLIAIVLGSDDHFRDASILLDYGFNNFARLILAEKGEPLALFHIPNGNPQRLPAVAAETVQVVMPKALLGRIRCKVRQNPLPLPIRPGDIVGEVVWEVPGASRHAVSLVAQKTVKPAWWLQAPKVAGALLLALFSIAVVSRLWRKWRKGGRRR